MTGSGVGGKRWTVRRGERGVKRVREPKEGEVREESVEAKREVARESEAIEGRGTARGE